MIKYIGTMALGMSLACQTVVGQQRISDEAISAMSQELQRNMTKLALPQMPTPFFIAYGLSDVEEFSIQAQLGILSTTYYSPLESKGAVQLLVGDETCTSEVNYDGRAGGIVMPADKDANVIQRNFWLLTDDMYKGALQMYGGKQSYLRINPLPENERNLPDFVKVENVNYTQAIAKNKFIDIESGEELARKLSALFLNYKDLFNTSVTLSGVATNVARITSNNVNVRHNQGLMNLVISATVVCNDGVHIPDKYVVSVRNFDELPSYEELKSSVEKFATNLLALKDAETINEFYSGPVLFESSATNMIFLNNFIHSDGLISRRPQIGKSKGNTLDKRMGRKVVDNRISIYNYTDKNKYDNKTLWGCYEIDAEGVVPQKELTLIENGILKRTLVGTYPTPEAKEVTGSSRFIIHPNEIAYITAPGTIHIKADKGIKQEQMKRQLIKAAKEEGLDYAYRIERLSGRASTIYRVDVKTGNETRVRFADLAGVDLAKLKRLGAISRQENVYNFSYERGVLCSMICPGSIIMDDVELNVPNIKPEPDFFLTMPKQRQ